MLNIVPKVRIHTSVAVAVTQHQVCSSDSALRVCLVEARIGCVGTRATSLGQQRRGA